MDFKVKVTNGILHFELDSVHVLKYDVLSDHPTMPINKMFMYGSIAIDKSGTHTGIKARAGVLFYM